MIVALIAVLAAGGQGASATTPTTPRWSLRDDSGRCQLEHRSTEAVLSIDTVPGSDHYDLAIAAATVTGPTRLHPATVTFAPSGAVVKGLATLVNLPDGTRGVVMSGLPAGWLAGLAGAERVAVVSNQGLSAAITVPGATKAVAAFRRCAADLLTEWGADPAQFAAGGTTPVALKDRDYWLTNAQLGAIGGQSPRTDIRDDFRLIVEPDGRAGECHALSPKTEPVVERIACGAVVGKQLFTPAKGIDNTPVRGVATFRVALLKRAN